MFFRYRTKGFVIGKKDRGEYDRIFTIYTKEFGKTCVLGRSIKKGASKLRFGVSSFSLIDVEFIEGRVYKTLTDVSIVRNYLETGKDLKRISLVNKIAEDLNLLIGHQENDQEIWKLLESTLNDTEESYNYLIYYHFLWRLLLILGYAPDLYHCISCKDSLKDENLYFSFKDGGIFCSKCVSLKGTAESFPVAINVIKIIRIILKGDKETLLRLSLDKESERSINILSQQYIDYCAVA